MDWRIFPSLQQPVLTDAQQPEAVSEDKWHRPFSEPVRQRIAPRLAIALAVSGLTAPPFVLPAPSEAMAWHRPLSEPVRVKPALRTALHQYFAVDTVALTNPEVVSTDKWFPRLSEPVRVRLSLPVYQQQAFAFVKASPFPETVFPDKYWRPLAEPVRLPRALGVQQQKAAFLVKATPFGENVNPDKWFVPLSDPMRRIEYRQRVAPANFFVNIRFGDGTIQELSWIPPLARPYRSPFLPVAVRDSQPGSVWTSFAFNHMSVKRQTVGWVSPWKIFANIDDDWQPVVAVYVKRDGAWEQFFRA